VFPFSIGDRDGLDGLYPGMCWWFNIMLKTSKDYILLIVEFDNGYNSPKD